MNQLKYLVLFLFFNSNIGLFAQFTFNIIPCETNDDVIALVDSVFLSNMDAGRISNISFQGDPTSVGYYYNGFFLGFNSDRGIVMSTGFAANLDGPNSCATHVSGNNAGGSDPDLVDLANSNINDACIIEFDFMPIGDTSEFDFVFGSEEYHEYVNMAFNDVFGFFMSGPGISGPFSNDAVNIGLIPQTNLPITVNTLNCGRQTTACTPPPGGAYCEYLIDNTDPNEPGFQNVSIDAYTTPIIAKHVTQPNQWYHIKLAIGDAADYIYDSGVFFELGSFYTGININVGQNEIVDDTELLVDLFPNPTKKSVNIVLKSEKNVKFELSILNQFGKQVFTQRYGHSGGKRSYKIELPNLNPGIHFVKVLTSSGTTKLLKLEVVN